MSEPEAYALLQDWRFWARPDQLPPPGDWRVWLCRCGRAWGKTRTGAEWIIDGVRRGLCRHVALVAQTAGDARDTIVEGVSGILACSHDDFRPNYEPSKRRLTWPNGAIATTYSGDEPGQLRGPNLDRAWVDELCKYRYPRETWDNLQLALRIGECPQCIVTTTPTPSALLREITDDPATVLVTGSTYDNLANLAPGQREYILRRYEGTRLGRQELHAEVLEDVPGALWQRSLIDALRVMEHPDLVRIVVGVDPAATSGEEADETGIVVVGRGVDDHGYVLDDLSLRDTPAAWASAAITAYHKHSADAIIAEANQGGEMVAHTIHTVNPRVPVTLVHASRGKITRAEPVATQYEQRSAHHVGTFAVLEDQMCSFAAGSKDSPDHMDAMVWAFAELFPDGWAGPIGISSLEATDPRTNADYDPLDDERLWSER